MNNKYKWVALCAIWISFSEFIRNEYLLKIIWINHYKNLWLIFKTSPLNWILWIIWSLFLAILITELRRNNTKLKTITLTWLFSFVMMWLVLYNLQVLPLKILIYWFPLSIIEVYIWYIILDKYSKIKH